MIGIADFLTRFSTGQTCPVTCRIEGRPAAFQLSASAQTDGQVWEDAQSGIRLELAITHHEDPRFLQWQGTLVGGSEQVRIEEVRLADLRIEHPVHERGMAFRKLTGGTAKHDSERLFPPCMFRVIDQELHGHDIVRHYDLTGRGSNEFIPLWLLEEDGRGLWFGPEWCGSWQLEIHRLPEYSTVLLSLPRLDFVLQPGEQIELPVMALGEFAGDLEDGCNQVRRVISRHYLPDFQGQPPEPRFFYHVFGGPRERMGEPTVHHEVDVAAELGAEAFTYASTWHYDDDPEKRLNWWNLMGDYTPAAGRFPDGIEPLADHLAQKNMDLGLWIDPRVGLNSEVVNDPKVREALLFCDDTWEEELRGQYNPISYDINVQPLMDLSRPEGRELFAGHLENMVSDSRARKIWFDLNCDPTTYFFQTNEQPDRRGLLELEWFRGLSQVLRDFHRAHPDVWIEMCASGGRMINLESLALGHSQWITDYTGNDPDIAGAIRTGANSILPAVVVHQSYYIPKGKDPDEDVEWDRLLAHFAGDFGLGPELYTAAERHLRRIGEAADLWRKIKHVQGGDFYRLTPPAETRDAWDAWQFHDPSTGEGVVCVRRLSECTRTNGQVTLRGIPAGAAPEIHKVFGDAQLSRTENRLGLNFQRERVWLALYKVS